MEVTITPAVTQVITPEVINVPMTRKEAQMVRGLLGECSCTSDLMSLRQRLVTAGIEREIPLNSADIPAIKFAAN